MVFHPYRLYMTNIAEGVETCSIFHCRDNTDALIKTLEIISRRCQKEIYGYHKLVDSCGNIVALDSFLDDCGCPQARYDPLRRDSD
jgi:hypothetical protein